MSRQIYALDIETSAIDKKDSGYAGLEPWRIWSKRGHITSYSICAPDGTYKSRSRRFCDNFEAELYDDLVNLQGKVVYCHYTVFDVAWMIATFKKDRMDVVPEIFSKIDWYDTAILTKWVINGQKAEELKVSYSLINLCKVFLKDHPLLAEFIQVKSEKVEAFENNEYWERRNALDAIMTQALAVKLEDKLASEQRRGYMTESANIVPVANSWIIGIHINKERLKEVGDAFLNESKSITDELQLNGSILSSPAQLGDLLFRKLGIKPESLTPTGRPSCAADDLKLIHYKLQSRGDEGLAWFMKKVIRYKQLNTLLSKYINGTNDALGHTQDGFIYGAPKIFGTYTGRFTYSSKTLDTYQTGIALHQIPRKDREIRSFMEPPPGWLLHEADASGQESRLMAIRSNDKAMLRVFADKKNFHAMTGASFMGMEYDDFMAEYLKENGHGKFTEQRQFGKLSNLSCNYRIGAKALAKKAFDDYDTVITVDKAMFFINGFNRIYNGVPSYWEEVIEFAKQNGYTEAFGGRRYKLYNWTPRFSWASESSAINLPIQGSGAAMKNIAINEIFTNVKNGQFVLDLHDATFTYIPDIEVGKQIDHTLNSINYERYWGFKPPIELPYETKIGRNWSEVK